VPRILFVLNAAALSTYGRRHCSPRGGSRSESFRVETRDFIVVRVSCVFIKKNNWWITTFHKVSVFNQYRISSVLGARTRYYSLYCQPGAAGRCIRKILLESPLSASKTDERPPFRPAGLYYSICMYGVHGKFGKLRRGRQSENASGPRRSNKTITAASKLTTMFG